MDSPLMRLREREWFSAPSSTRFCDPGDRFIPTRSLMNLDLAHCLLTTKDQARTPNQSPTLTSKEEYRRRLEENLTLDDEGKPFRMLVFKPSPKKCKKSLFLVDEMLQDEKKPPQTPRCIPTVADRILDGPKILDDYYLNLLDWGKSNILAIALGSSLYLWNAANSEVRLLLTMENEEDYPTSVSWSDDGKTLAVGFASSKIELWDAVALSKVRALEGPRDRVGSLSWNEKILTSGSRDTSIINHDVRSFNQSKSYFQGHTQEVCGLRWSSSGNFLASGGNDNIVHVWESSKMGSSKFLHRFTDHSAAVRALAWCPFQSHRLASGGGTLDQCIKIWNTQLGKCIKSTITGAQVCALEWNRHQKEILSAHGYNQNQLSLWAYPSMSKVTDLRGHTARVLHLAQSPDGSTLVSAAADETIRFWKVFEPPSSSTLRSSIDESHNFFSLKRMHIR
ncbi:cell division cycle 20 cofactor of APC complex protein [Dioscorea alata]|uniref:Cell division cycle 20 cofactor of APC complex protein n=1 Tax=Dioscorea alata TaxID=55571 RepID=A0ACB7WW90_DIOAL|nr:cell division cycle 20 cofactor of APC complex protein [Dioscorea alata]